MHSRHAIVMLSNWKPEMINRRKFIWSTAALMTHQLPIRSTSAKTVKRNDKFPFEVIDVTVENALHKAKELSSPDVVSVISGSRDRLEVLKDPFNYADANPGSDLKATLRKAKELNHPADLQKFRNDGNAEACKLLKEQMASPGYKPIKMHTVDETGKMVELPPQEVRRRLLAGCDAEKVSGWENWPEESGEEPSPEVFVLALFGDSRLGTVIKIPTDDWTTIPAHLRWGGWNEHPHAEYHVAAWRAWRDRYGANLIGMTHDTLIMKVEKPPNSRKEAYKLAEEQYLYCNDIVDQGVGSVTNLAAGLLNSKYWFFWWD